MDTDKGVARAGPAARVRRRAPAPPGYTEFFRGTNRDLRKFAMYVGATRDEAKDAAASALAEVLARWGQIDDPLAYAKRAVVSNFLKDKTRNLERTRRRMVERSAGTATGREDSRLTFWEDREWVMQMLRSLPAGQREVMAFVVDGFKPTEIAALLGKSPEAVRDRLRDARRRLEQRYWQELADSDDPDAAGSPRKEAR